MADLYYYETGYIDESYFVYTADAASAISASTSVSCDATVIAGGVIVEGTSSWMSDSSITAAGNITASGASAMSSEFTQTAMISHIEGADLFAMSNSALAAEASRIRDNNISASSAFTIATDASRTRNYSSEDSADFTISVANQRVRFNEAALDAAFSLLADNERVRFANADLSSTGSVSCDAERIPGGVVVEASADLSSSSSIIIDNIRLRLFDIALSTAITQTSQLDGTLQAESNLTSTVNLSATISHIEGADLSAFTDASLTTQANVIVDTVVSVSSNASTTTQADRLRDIVADLLASATQQTDANRLRGVDSSILSSASVSADVNQTVQLSAVLSSTFTQTASISHIEGADLSAFTDASLTASADRLRDVTSTISSTTNLTSSISQTISVTAALTTAVSLTTTVNKLQSTPVSLSSSFAQTTVGTKFTDFFTIKIKDVPDGTNQWYSSPRGLYVDTTGNMYSTSSMGTGATGYSGYPALTKVNKSGEHQWTKTVETLDKGFTNVVVDSSENLYTAIETSNSVFKYNTSGTVVWRYNTSNTTVRFGQVAIDSSDNLIAVGSITISSVQYAYVIKINSSGALQWNRRFTTASSITNVITDGTSIYVTTANSLTKLDSTGAHVWTRTISKNSSVISNTPALNKDASGNVYVSCIDSASTGYFLIKLDSSGIKLWHRDYANAVYNIHASGSDLYALFAAGITSIDSSNGAIIWQKLYAIAGTNVYIDGTTGLVEKNSGLYYSAVNVEDITPYQYSSLLLKFPTDGSGIPTVGTYTVANISDTTTSTTSFNTTAATVSNVTGITLTTNTTTLGTKTPTTTFNDVNPGGYLLSGAAALTTAVTLTGALDVVRLFNANISTTSLLSAQADDRVKSGTANLSANGFVVAVSGRILPQVAALDSNFTLAVSVDKIKLASSALSSTFVLTAQALDLDLASINLSSAFTMTAQVDKLRNFISTQPSQSTMTVRGTKTISAWGSDSWYRGATNEYSSSFVVLESHIYELGQYQQLPAKGLTLFKRDFATGNIVWKYNITIPSSVSGSYTTDITSYKIREYNGLLYINAGYTIRAGTDLSYRSGMLVIDPETQEQVDNFPTSFASVVYDFDIDDSGIYYSGAYAQTAGWDPIVTKTNLTGDIQWTKYVNYTNSTISERSRIILKNNKLYWTYTIVNINSQYHNMYVAEVNKSTGSSGTTRSTGTVGSGDIFVDDFENYYILGSSATPLNTNGFFAKINSDGTTAWSKKVFKTVDRGLIEVDAEGNIYISEQSFESLIDPNTTIKPSVMKFTSDGTFIWGRQLTDGVAYSNASQISAILTYDDRLLFSGKYGNSLMVNIPAIDGDKVSSFWLNYAPSLTSNSYTIGSSSSLTLVNSPMDMGGGWGGVLEANSNTPLTYLYIVAGYSDNNNSTFTQNIAYTRIRFGASAQTSRFTQTATGLKLAQLSATLSASTTISANLKRIRFSSAALTTTATVTCTGKKLTGYSAALQSQAQLSSTPNRLRGISETLAANATQTVDNTRLRDNSAAFTAFYTELAIAFKNATGTVLLESVATMAIDARKITDSPQFMFSQTQMTARGFNTQYGSASLAASSTFVLVPTYLRRNEVAMTSNTSLTVPGERIRPGTSNQVAQAFVSASTEDSKITGYSAALASTSQMVTNNQILRLAQANLLSTSAMPLVFVGILVRVEANLQVNGFVLSAGEILNIDLFYQLKIPSETRTLWIEPESRILSIDSETRVNKIKGYPTP